MNIVILGPGAIGSLWAYSLRQQGHNVSLWSHHTTPILSIQLDNHCQLDFNNRDNSALECADLLLVTLKAPNVEAALMPLRSLVHSDCIITLMHNGMGTAELVERCFPNNPLLLATTTHGAYRPEKNKVLHTGFGTTQIGGYNLSGQRCSFVKDVLDNALNDVFWNDEIETALWNKLAINCAINPVTALYNVNNGALVEEQYQRTLNGISSEVCKVMNAEGIDIQTAQLDQTIHQVIRATAANYSSMQQDIAHRRLSEIDFITGYLLNRAAHHGIATPYNQELYQAIKHIEQSWN